MMTIAQFEAMIPLGKSITLADCLDQALRERGAAASDMARLRLSSFDHARALICELYDQLTLTAKNYLVDPAELTLAGLRNHSIRTHNLATLAAASDRDLLVPIAFDLIHAQQLIIYRHNLPPELEDSVLAQYERPRLLPRCYGEYFRQAAQMVHHLRYYALPALQDSFRIPAFAAGNSVSCIYCIRINAPTWDAATEFRFSKIWENYLAPGRYDFTSFNLDVGEDLSRIVFAGYIDLQNNLQFFTT